MVIIVVVIVLVLTSLVLVMGPGVLGKQAFGCGQRAAQYESEDASPGCPFTQPMNDH